MSATYQAFVNAIHGKLLVQVVYNSHEKGQIIRKCVPFDYGPSKKYKDGKDRFHFHDLDSPSGQHNLSAEPHLVVSITVLTDSFNPADFVTWTPNWILKRDWGHLS